MLLTVTAGGLAGLATLAGFLGAHWWFLDLFSHFRVQYLVILSVTAATLFICRQSARGAMFAALAFLNASVIAPYYVSAGIRDRPDGRNAHLKALMLNANTYGGDPVRVAALIDEQTPDIIVLAEVDHRWLASLRQTLAPYHYRVLALRSDNFGIALLSKVPLTAPNLLHHGAQGVPSVEGTIHWQGEAITVLGTHPVPPYNAKMAQMRDQQLLTLGMRIRGLPKAILLGDLNATPWSFGYQLLATASGMTNCRLGRGLQPSWPSQVWPLRISIDHCLATESVRVTKKWIGPDVGSDHFPLFIEISPGGSGDLAGPTVRRQSPAADPGASGAPSAVGAPGAPGVGALGERFIPG